MRDRVREIRFAQTESKIPAHLQFNCFLSTKLDTLDARALPVEGYAESMRRQSVRFEI